MEQKSLGRQVLLGFELPRQDADSMLSLLTRIRQNPNEQGLSKEAAQMVSRLLELGIDALYFDVMSQIAAHPSTKRSADKGIQTVTSGAKLVIRKMINTLEPHELPLFADYMDSLLVCSKTEEWHLAFPLSQALATDLNRTMVHIRSDAETHTYNAFIADTLCKISDQAIVYFYNKPTQLFKNSPIREKICRSWNKNCQ